MICPGCKKDNFYEISVCVTCGTMINDSVREELAVKITPLKIKSAPKINMNSNPAVQKKPIQKEVKTPSNFVLAHPKSTSEISSPKTSPTLVEFQNKNAKIPEWRLQLQNAVRQRYKTGDEGNIQPASENKTTGNTSEIALSTNGNTALKVDFDEKVTSSKIDNNHLRKALERIELSRKRFLREEPEVYSESPEKETVSSSTANGHQLRIATVDDKPAPISDELKISSSPTPKPRLVPKKKKPITNFYDTSELDPDFIPAKVSSSFEKTAPEKLEKDPNSSVKKEETVKAENKLAETEKVENKLAEVAEEQFFDDYAPFSLRFNAGLFDLIIGSFLSLILLSPFMLLGGNWFTVAGTFAFLATTALVMFIYQTTTIGMYGKTFGMHLFSLEMIDFNGEDYPNFHQAAVSSSIYLLSITFFGLGFITSFFDEEKRSIHDIVSRTLVVREI